MTYRTSMNRYTSKNNSKVCMLHNTSCNTLSWFISVLEKFEEREYETMTEFVTDFRQMLENCYRYNGPDHFVSKRGQKLETMMEQKLALLSRLVNHPSTQLHILYSLPFSCRNDAKLFKSICINYCYLILCLWFLRSPTTALHKEVDFL